MTEEEKTKEQLPSSYLEDLDPTRLSVFSKLEPDNLEMEELYRVTSYDKEHLIHGRNLVPFLLKNNLTFETVEIESLSGKSFKHIRLYNDEGDVIGCMCRRWDGFYTLFEAVKNEWHPLVTISGYTCVIFREDYKETYDTLISKLNKHEQAVFGHWTDLVLDEIDSLNKEDREVNWPMFIAWPARMVPDEMQLPVYPEKENPTVQAV